MSDTTITLSGGDWRVTVDDDGDCIITNPDDVVVHRTANHAATAIHLAMTLGTLAGIRPIDIEDLRKRHANSILNTATGRALGAALDELEELKNLKRKKNDADDLDGDDASDRSTC